METATINKICVLPGLGTLIGAGTIAYHLPLAVFKSGAMGVGFIANFLECPIDIRDWYARRAPELKIEVFSHNRQVLIGLIRMLPVIGAVWLVWWDFCSTHPSEAYVNQLCIIPGLGTVIGFLTLMDYSPLATIAKIFSVVVIKGYFALENNNTFGPIPEELRNRNIQNYNQMKEEALMNTRMTLIGLVRIIPVIGGATLALNDCYRFISFLSAQGNSHTADITP